MEDSNWIVTEAPTPNEKEEEARARLSIGDTVKCMSAASRHQGQIGKVLDIGFYVLVEYPNTPLRGHHPALILQKIDTETFNEDLFTI
jgi:hypothetical protein